MHHCIFTTTYQARSLWPESLPWEESSSTSSWLQTKCARHEASNDFTIRKIECFKIGTRFPLTNIHQERLQQTHTHTHTHTHTDTVKTPTSISNITSTSPWVERRTISRFMTNSTAFKTHCIWWTEVEFRLLGGCVRVKSECNATFQHLKHIALYGQNPPESFSVVIWLAA